MKPTHYQKRGKTCWTLFTTEITLVVLPAAWGYWWRQKEGEMEREKMPVLKFPSSRWHVFFHFFAFENLLRTHLPKASTVQVLGQIQSLKLLLGELCLPLNLFLNLGFPVSLGIEVDNTDYKKVDVMILTQSSFSFLDTTVQAQESELCVASSCHILMLKLWRISQSMTYIPSQQSEKLFPDVLTEIMRNTSYRSPVIM